jgi:hypothetical protein
MTATKTSPTLRRAAVLLALAGAATQADPLQVSTASGVKASLYGFVQLDGSWENQRAYPDPGNYAVWAQTGLAAASGEWNWTADNSRLGVNLAGPDGEGLALAGKLEFDFYGGGTQNAPVPRLRHAYGTVSFPKAGLSFLAGQTWDLVAPLNVPTLNAGVLYYAGNLGNARRPQLRVTETVALPGNGKWEIAAAVARTIGNATNAAASGSDAGHDADIPTFQGRTAVSLPLWVEKQPATLGVSGHYAQEALLQPDYSYKNVDSWSGAVDLELPLVSVLSLAGEGWRGGDLSTYNGGIGQGIVNGVAVEGWGGWFALRLKVGAVTANLGGGLDSVQASKVAAGGRTRNTSAFGNVGYNLNASSKVAVELQRLETDYKGGASEELWRTQLAYSYSF